MTKLLIVDDSEVVSTRLEEMLYETVEIERIDIADSIKKAKDKIGNTNYDFVVLDIHLPDGNGIALLPEIKANSSKCRVLVLTDYPYPQYRKKCLEQGADHFLVKAVDIDRVPEILQTQKHRKASYKHDV
jgi:response regulator of citrate/malate metabolism